MKSIVLNGIKVFDHGNESSQPIIFVHSFPMNSRMWDFQTGYFKEKYRVITYDLRSFGQSKSTDSNFTIESHSDDVLEIINHLKLVKPVICGLSMGGYIVLRTLEKAPDVFKAVILCDTKAEADANETKLKRALQIKQIKSGGRKDFVDSFIAGVLSPSNTGTSTEKISRDIISEQSDECICSALMTMAARADKTSFLEHINIPVLIIVGEDDKLTPIENSISMQNKILVSRLEKIPKAGHFTNIENPSQFNNVFEAFMRNI